MNNDDMELFGKINNKFGQKWCEILMIDNKKMDLDMSLYPYNYLKKYGTLSSINDCKLFRIKGCSDFSIVIGSCKKETDPNVSKGIIKKAISDFYKLEGKNLKLWSPINTDEIAIDNRKYTCCKQLKKELNYLCKFLHASMPKLIKRKTSTAQKLMTLYTDSMGITQYNPILVKENKNFLLHFSFIEKLKFLNNATLIYQNECHTDGWEKI